MEKLVKLTFKGIIAGGIIILIGAIIKIWANDNEKIKTIGNDTMSTGFIIFVVCVLLYNYWTEDVKEK